ncbi:MAG: ferritin [Bacteroidota bacterium]|nr:ferritin [Bacteroidota bacterium]
MLSQIIQDALNEQIKNELFSAYLYLSMSAYCAEASLPGFAQWMRLQSGEENTHAMKIFSYILERTGHVELQALEKPQSKFASPMALFKQVLEHEKKVTGMINNLYELAVKEKDYPTEIMLEWFITEQLEEEKTAGEIIQLLTMVGENGPALLMLDRQLAARGAK